MLYFEDFSVGQTFESRSYELSEEALISFAEHYDPQPFHINTRKAKDSFFKGLAASGWQVGAITMRLLTECLPIASGIIGGGVNLKWVTPTRPGDQLKIKVEVLKTTPSQSKPDRGVVDILVTTTNQHNETRQTLESTLLVFKNV